MSLKGTFTCLLLVLLLAGCGGDGGSSMTTGLFVDSAVEGVGFTTSSGGSGTTNAAGELDYLPGDTVTFSIGNLVLGACTGQALIMPADITASSDAELNLARFLQTIDDDGDPDNGITIDPAVAAVIDAALAGGASIDFSLDSVSFATDTDLADLLATIDTVTTANTETLVSAAAARAHLDTTLAGLAGTSVYTIDISGGDGGFAGGNNLGYFNLEMDAGDGAIEILATGAADASFTPTGAGAPYLGDRSLEISVDMELMVYDTAIDTPPAAVGVLYQKQGLYWIYVTDGDTDFSNDTYLTGLSIAPGVTLTLNDVMGDGTGYVSFNNGLVNRGTITGADIDASQRLDLKFEAENFVNLGRIESNGILPGQNGGFVYILANGNAGGDGDIINQGPILTYGANNSGGDAGNGGEVYAECYVNGRIENIALIDAHGGTASGGAGAGGAGGDINIFSNYDLNSAGHLIARGGDGVDQGGAGGSMNIWAVMRGSLRNSGTLDLSGGSTRNGRGGWAGYLDFSTYGGDLISSGNVLAAGGDSGDMVESGPLLDGLPGIGGYYSAFVFPDTIDGSVPAGDAIISGNIDLSGGDSPLDGAGSGYVPGGLYVTITNVDDAGSQKISLLGYASVDVSGGNGSDHGGVGGEILLENNGIGPITNEALLLATGGDGDPLLSGSVGGVGGNIYIFGLAGGCSTTLTPLVNGGAGETAGRDGVYMINQLP